MSTKNKTLLVALLTLIVLTLYGAGTSINGSRTLQSTLNYCAPVTASGTTYACNMAPALAAYATGACYSFKADVANTGAVTINFNSLGAKSVVKATGGITTALVANDILASQVVNICYDGTNMQMQSTLGNVVGGVVTCSSGITNNFGCLVQTCTASASATCDFTAITSTYDEYIFEITNLVNATDNVSLYVLVSTDGGSTWASTTYSYANNENAADSSSGSIANSSSTSQFIVSGTRIGIGNGTGKGLTMRLELSAPLSASLWKSIRWQGVFIRTGSNIAIFPGGQGNWQTTTAVNAIRFQFSSGNITSGAIRLYGIAKS